VNPIANNVWGLVWNILSTQKFDHEIWHTMKRRKIVQTWKKRPEFCLSFANKNLREKPIYFNYASLSSLYKGKEAAKAVYEYLFPWITGIKTNMLLIFFLGLIATLTLVSGDCDLGTRGLKHFNWNEVCITVLTRFLKYRVVKTAAWIYMSFMVPLTNSR